MTAHDKIELPQGYAERPFDYSGDLYTEGQMRTIIEDNRNLVAERDTLREALEVMVEMIEMKGFGFHYAMDLARAALDHARRAREGG